MPCPDFKDEMSTPLIQAKASRVLIGITTRNRGDILPKALNSAAEQDYTNKCTVVVDDASTDSTNGICDSYPDVQWIRYDFPRGYRENRNSMMQMPGVDYYVSLDDDAWFLRTDEISVAVSRMEADQKIGAIAFDILSPSEPGVKCRTNARETSNFIGCGHLLRISAVREAGWYEPSPGDYGGEERDLCIRLMDLGYRIDFLPGVHVWHDKAWDGRDWYPLHKSLVCNDLVMSTRRCPLPLCLGVVPYKIFSHLRFGFRKREFLRAAVAGIFSWFYHIPVALHSRRPVKGSVFWRACRK
jgi:glycosyltransferase involved in cell wall biosynthesis